MKVLTLLICACLSLSYVSAQDTQQAFLVSKLTEALQIVEQLQTSNAEQQRLQSENEALLKDRQSWTKERATLQSENEAIRADKDNLLKAMTKDLEDCTNYSQKLLKRLNTTEKILLGTIGILGFSIAGNILLYNK